MKEIDFSNNNSIYVDMVNLHVCKLCTLNYLLFNLEISFFFF